MGCSSTTITICTDLIIWSPPRFVFFPPVQERPPPKALFKHIDLNIDGQGCLDLPDHHDHCPEIFLNDTFVQFLFNPPKGLPYYPYPQDDDDESSLESIDEDPPYYNNTQASDTFNQYQDPQILYHPQGEFEDDGDSSLQDHIHTPSRQHQNRVRKPTKIFLKRKLPEPEPEAEDVFYQVDDTDHPSTSKRSKTNENQDEAEEQANIDQWRFEKTPGHQGSHLRSIDNTDGDQHTQENGDLTPSGKRKLDHSITNSAERVLKRPFRPPTKIHLTHDEMAGIRARSLSQRPSTSSPPSSPPPVTPTNPLTATKFRTYSSAPAAIRGPSRGGSSIDPNFPVFVETATTRSNTKSKTSTAFKPPVRAERSTAPTPSSSAANRTSVGGNKGRVQLLPPAQSQAQTSTSGRSNQATIAVLEKEILKHKQAIRYIAECDEDRLQGLISQWRAAGREVVERMFDIMPRPEESQSGISGMTYQRSWNDDPSQGLGIKLTDEQEEFLRNAPTNRDGDPVDEEGNLLIPDSGTEEEMRQLIQSEGCERFGQRYEGNWQDSYHDNSNTKYENKGYTPTLSPISNAWNMGRMMTAIGLNPLLLGWDAENEDWVDYTRDLEPLD